MNNNYIMMTLEEAQRLAKKNAIVYVSEQDLEKEDCNIGFERKRFGDCKELLEDAETIAHFFDKFMNQLKLFSEQQTDVVNYESKGRLSTILIPSKE